MHHEDCSSWEYGGHPARADVTSRCANFLVQLRTKTEEFKSYPADTRQAHSYIFENVAPVACPEIIGNYRGSEIPCLKNYPVYVPMDRRVGTQPNLVKRQMSDLATHLNRAIQVFDKAWAARKVPDDDAVFLVKLVQIAAHFLQRFLTVHPYANGNGHMGRMIVWVLLGRFGYWPVKWPLDESPPYYQALTDHRDGNTKPLTDFILLCIRG